MIKIILITGFLLASFLITMLVIVARDQQRQIRKSYEGKKIKILK